MQSPALSICTHHRHVWLVPTYTRDVAAAATSFHIVVQNNSDSKIDDLARGAGGGYRYLFCKVDKEEPKKIVHAVLFRTSTGINSTPAGWDMMTADINKGRRKSRLYILLKTTDDQAKSVTPHASARLTANKYFRTLLSVPNVSGYLSTRSSGYASARSSGYLTARNSAMAKEYVQRLDVHYGDDPSAMPSDSIREIHDLSAEIMYQEGGRWFARFFSENMLTH